MPDDQIQPERPSRRDGFRESREDRPRRRTRREDDEDDEDEDDDEYEDRERFRRRDGGLNTLIPYRNPLALTGYYLAVFSLIPCIGLLLSPIAVVLGILGLNHRNRQPAAGGLAHAIVALILGSLTGLVNLVVILLVFILR